MEKKMLWEDDQIVDMQTGKCMIIRFGEYETYCVEEEQVMKSVGFYLETRNGENLPLGTYMVGRTEFRYGKFYK